MNRLIRIIVGIVILLIAAYYFVSGAMLFLVVNPLQSQFDAFLPERLSSVFAIAIGFSIIGIASIIALQIMFTRKR